MNLKNRVFKTRYCKRGKGIRTFASHMVAALVTVSWLFWGCTSKPTFKIGVSQNSTDDWREKMNSEMMLEMYQYPDAQLEIRSAEDDNGRQLADIQYFIDRKVDVLIVSPREAEAITPLIRKAREAGIKVLVFDRETTGDDFDMFYGADNTLIGSNVAMYLQKWYGHRSEENPLKVLEIRGLDGSSPSAGRHNGFAEGIKGNGKVKLLASAGGDWNFERAEVIADSLLSLYPETEVIYAHNDRMALAARSVALRHGRGDIKILGVDGSPKIGLRAVADGKIDATFVYPTNGAEILGDAVGLARGEEKPKRVIAESAMAIDKSNVDLQLLSANTLTQALAKMQNLNTRMVDYVHTGHILRNLLWALGALLILAASVVFLVLRLYWTRKRTHAILEEQNEKLRTQRDDLERLNTQLEEATASKLNFFTNVSHDLRTPLTLISAPLDTVAADPRISERSKALIAVAIKNVKILQRLINQILDFQKFESGKLNLDLSVTDITQDIKEWTSAFQGAARNKDIRLDLELVPDAPCTVALDRDKVERIFFNLLSNAFRFTPSNGRITVKLDTTAKDGLVFTVTDNGKGISAENLPHLFERFFQGREGNAGGSGIGLVVVKNFVQLHGGEISVDSEPGCGTCFRVVLPKRDATEAVKEDAGETANKRSQLEITTEIGRVELPADQTGEPEEEQDKPTVLIVDDNEDLRSVARALLEGDYNVLTAQDGESGIRMANKYVPDCVVSDVMMPGIDGLELTRRLKGESVTSHIPIILLTACALDEQRAAGYDSGADGYLAKPFNEKVLRSRIASVIANRRLLKASPAAEIPLPEIPQKPGKDSKARQGVSGLDPFSELDSTFYRNFASMVVRDMGDPELSVEGMASNMGMSRVQFYRKLKALTNYSPADLLRMFRLRRAKEMLMSDEDTTVAEVAYAVGFSSPSYFAKCFKDQFGELPSELQDRTSRMGS